jgi:hypothetical protein
MFVKSKIVLDAMFGTAYSSHIDHETGNVMDTNESIRPIRYVLIDTKTNGIVKSYANRDAAMRAADKKDAAYGAVRFIVQPIWA